MQMHDREPDNAMEPQADGLDPESDMQMHDREPDNAIEERREAVAELTDEGMSAPEIADTLGVSEKTVDRDRSAMSGTNVPDDLKGMQDGKDELGTNVPERAGART